jgi:type II restriction enzyme
MSSHEITSQLEKIQQLLPALTPSQLGWIESVTDAFSLPKHFNRLNNSDLVSASMLASFGDALRIHHCFSREPFSKDKFEYTLERVLQSESRDAILASRGNPGQDITIDGQGFSLKTEAAANINNHKIHISKFHELGKGHWVDNVADLYGLRDQFSEHLNHYDRVLVLRKLRRSIRFCYAYELVEIPKPLLELAALATPDQFEMRLNSAQTPKPGYCYIPSRSAPDFMLYFDGGTERKLQIKGLLKSRCRVHATWEFDVVEQ